MRPARITGLLAIALILGLVAPVGAQEIHEIRDMLPPHPEPMFLHEALPAAPCTVENEYEAAIYGMDVDEVRYPDQCQRLKFAFGPIVVKPGENDALLEPVTIEKPAYAGHVVRFKPNLVEAATGESPRTDDMHLHHATWLSAYPQYGPRIPFFAAGEEKTIATFPEGYGLPVSPQDVWLLLYMVHNDNADTNVVWLTYDIDYIAADDAEDLDLADIVPIWLDVQGSQVHPESPSTGSNPVFNVQRGFGHIDEETDRHVCTWPKENCARHDTYGLVTPNQGKTVDDNGNPIEIPGADLRVSSSMEGTLIGIGGHLHFGGLRVEVSQVRGVDEELIMISDALYWDWEDREPPGRVGAPPWSWDFSMTVTGAPDWKVKIREGDYLRINAVTDSEDASWYEGMGIAVAYVAPNDPYGPEGVDVFEEEVNIERGVPTRVLTPAGPWDVKNDWAPDFCEADLEGTDGVKTLCLRGTATHGPLEESSNHSGGCPEGGCDDFPDGGEGGLIGEIVSAGFTYGDADIGVTGFGGIPQIKQGEPTRFWNFDAVARVWHTYTRCEYPCTGQKDMQYPRADGGGFPEGDPMANVMDFDSNEIGFGTVFEPAAGQLPWTSTGKSPDQTVRDSFYWEFTPTEPGVYTFFCRIHKWMRGAVEVVE